MTSHAIFRNNTAQASPSAAVFRESTLRPHIIACGVLLSLLAAPVSSRAAELTASDAAANRRLSLDTDLSGDTAILHAIGGAYLFRDLDNAVGTRTESAKLVTSNPSLYPSFGKVVISGDTALVGAFDDLSGGHGLLRPALYLFRNLSAATGTVTQSVKLIPRNGALSGTFGESLSLSGTTAVVGDMAVDSYKGTAYVYRNLDTAVSGNVTEKAELTASDGEAGDYFGLVSLSGTTAIVSSNKGPYVYRNIDTVTGKVTESARLRASDGTATGGALISGNMALTGRLLFRNLDTATGTVAESARLTTVSGQPTWGSGDFSGNTAIRGVPGDSHTQGSAYIYRHLDSATGSIHENVKLTASNGTVTDAFGAGIALDGDRFVILAMENSGGGSGPGRAYSGRVSAFTTLDEGNAARATDRLSFVSQDDWVIGQSTAGNQLTLSAGDSGTVSAGGKAVYVGRAAGADRNRLSVAGNLTANAVRVGAAGNTGNSLRLSGMITTSGGVTVASGSSIGGDGVLTGDLTLEAGAFWEFATSSPLTVTGKVSMDRSFGVASLIGLDSGTANGDYTLIESPSTDFVALDITNWGESNAYDLGGGKSAWFERGSLRLVVVPEPTAGLLGLLAGAVGALTRRHRRR